MKTSRRLLFLFIVATLLTTPAFAQAYRSQLKFLEQYAVRQYERGDKEAALKQFSWILRIDPGSAVAREYVKKIAADPATAATPRPQRINEIISDITGVKADLIAYENEAHELERLIRDLITENDALYQALYKRSREVAEMRAKFYGTPYGDAYARTMKDLPIDRVPQRLHTTEDILPDDISVLTKTEENEISAILKDITALDRQKAADGTLPAEVSDALQTKRDMLINKTMTLAEKRESLNQLKDQLTDINAGLKRTNSRYLDAIDKIDTYYIRIKDELAKKNYIEQKMFSELVADYAEKVKEIEKLKNAVRQKDNALPDFKPALVSANNDLREIDATLRAKDDQLLKFKGMLLDFKKELAQRDTTIETQNAAIREREAALETQKATLLKRETIIETLNNAIREGETKIEDQKATILKREGTIETLNTAIRESDEKIKAQDEIIRRNQESLGGRDKVIARQQTEISLTASKLDAVSDKIAGIETALQDNASLLKTPALPAPSAPPENKNTTGRLELQARHIKALEIQNGNMAALLQKNEATLDEAARHITSLETQLAAVSAGLKKPLGLVNDQEKQTLRDDLARLKTELKLKQQDLDNTNASLNTLTIKEQELLTRIEGHEKLVKDFNALTQETVRLNALITKAKELEAANALQIKAIKKTAPDKAENTRLRQALLDTTAQVTLRSKELAEADKTITALQDDNKEKALRITELAARAVAFEQEARSLHPPSETNRACDMTAEQELKKRLIATTEKLSTAETRATSASLELENLREKLAASSRQIEELQAAPALKESADKKALIAAVVAKDEEIAALHARLKTDKDAIQQEPSAPEALQEKQVAALKNEILEQSGRIQMLTEANNDLSAQVQTLSRVNQNLAAKPQAPSTTPTDLSTSEQPLSAANDKLAVKLRKITAENNALSVQVQTLSDANRDLLTKDKALSPALHDLSAKVQTLSAANDELAAKLKTITTTNAGLSEKLSAATTTNNDLAVQVRTLSKVNQELLARPQAPSVSPNDLTSTVQTLSTANDKISGKLQTLTAANGDLSAQVKTLTKTNEELEARLKAASFPPNELTATVEALSKANQDLVARLKMPSTTPGELMATIQALSKANQDLVAKLKAPTIPPNELLTAVQTLTAANDDLSKKLEMSKQTNNGLTLEIQALAAANDELTSRIQIMAKTQNELVMKVNSLSARTGKPRPIAMELALDLDEKTKEVKRLQQQLDKANAAIKNDQDRARDAAVRKEADQIKQDAVNKILSERDLKISRLGTEIDALKKELATLQASRQEDLSRTNDANASRKIAEEQLASRDQEISQLKNKLRELSDDLKAAQALTAKKDRDHDATLKELRRLKDLTGSAKTDKKKAE